MMWSWPLAMRSSGSRSALPESTSDPRCELTLASTPSHTMGPGAGCAVPEDEEPWRADCSVSATTLTHGRTAANERCEAFPVEEGHCSVVAGAEFVVRLACVKGQPYDFHEDMCGCSGCHGGGRGHDQFQHVVGMGDHCHVVGRDFPDGCAHAFGELPLRLRRDGLVVIGDQEP
jgi:hypothetical protein